jgi:hypothetical protein
MSRTFLALTAGASGDAAIHGVDDSSDVFAVVSGANPLHEDWPRSAHHARGSRLVTWSGTLADDLFARHPGNWTGSGFDALSRRCAAIAASLRRQGFDWHIRPHARHVLSDVPSCIRFRAQHGGDLPGLALDPAALLEPTMLNGLDEHLTRVFEALGPQAAMVIVSDCEIDASSGAMRATAPGQGELPADLLHQLIDRCVPETTPIVLEGGEAAFVRRWLGF